MRIMGTLFQPLSVALGAEAVAVAEVEGMCSMSCLLVQGVDSIYSRRGTPSTRATVTRAATK